MAPFYMIREQEKENEARKLKLKTATKSNQKTFFTLNERPFLFNKLNLVRNIF